MGFLGQLFGGGTPEERFWRWFKANAGKYRDIGPKSGGLLNELGKQVEKVNKGLTFEIGLNEPREIIISADGDRKLFPHVRKLVNAAPEIPGWKVLAFRPRKAMDHSISMYGVKVDPNDMWFTAQPDGQKIGLTMYCKGWSEENKERLIGTAFILLDHCIGEYDTEMKLGFIEWILVKEKPELPNLRPLAELAVVVDKWGKRV